MFDKEPYYTEKIEAYLRDQLTEGEKAEFEQLLQQDPLLYNEFKLQQEVVTSIQAYRKSQLKQRLQNIDVNEIANGGTGFSAITGYIIGGAAALGLAGWLTLGFMKPDASASQETTAISTQPTVNSPSSGTAQAEPWESEPISFVDSVETSNTAGNTKPVEVRKETIFLTPGVVQPSTSQTINMATRNANAQSEKKPHTEETPRKAESDNYVKSTTAIADAESVARLHVTDNTNSKLKQHYYYLNNQLALLGFDHPYVLLEIQPVNSVYLFYEGQFFQLDASKNKPSPISENLVTDPDLIQKLSERLNQRD